MSRTSRGGAGETLAEPLPAVVFASVVAVGVFAVGLLWGPLDRASTGVRVSTTAYTSEQLIPRNAPPGGGPQRPPGAGQPGRGGPENIQGGQRGHPALQADQVDHQREAAVNDTSLIQDVLRRESRSLLQCVDDLPLGRRRQGAGAGPTASR